jgi:hypothetical protein
MLFMACTIEIRKIVKKVVAGTKLAKKIDVK